MRAGAAEGLGSSGPGLSAQHRHRQATVHRLLCLLPSAWTSYTFLQWITSMCTAVPVPGADVGVGVQHCLKCHGYTKHARHLCISSKKKKKQRRIL